jgi:2-dehydro-3-deoxyphosphogluconate aldolase/(4S)-4-hydroxy-2-oxoglutarate aldolase
MTKQTSSHGANHLAGQMIKQFAIPVLRHLQKEVLENSTSALADGGLSTVEITIMNDQAYLAIAETAKRPGLIVGAGTILNVTYAIRAVESGAKFLVSPGFSKKILEFAKQQGILYVPGVLTGTEIMRAQACGCEFVKVFPTAAVGGASYLKYLSGPFPEMQWMATGGVAIEDIPTYVSAGAACVGLGSDLQPKAVIQNKEWSKITEMAEQCVRAVESARGFKK